VSPSILADAADGNAPPKAPEARKFLSIRRGRRWAALVLPAALAVAVAASFLQQRLFAFIGVGSLGAILLVSSLHALTRCSRCGNRCFMLGPRLNPWATRCLHCRTRLYWSDAELDLRGAAHLAPPSTHAKDDEAAQREG